MEQYEINRKSQELQDSIKTLSEENEELKGEAESLSKKVSGLKKKILMATILGSLVIGAAAASYYYGEFQRQEILKETSITLGDWIVYDNDTALDSVNRLMWMTQDFRIIERRLPRLMGRSPRLGSINEC